MLESVNALLTLLTLKTSLTYSEFCTLFYAQIAKGMARMHDRLNIGKVIISPQKKPEEA